MSVGSEEGGVLTPADIAGVKSNHVVDHGDNFKLEDQVGKFLRSEIDRNQVQMNFDFKDGEGKHFLETAIDMLDRKGSLSIVDIGCGTGRTLHEVRDIVLRETGKSDNPKAVAAIGVNDSDFSQESMSAAVREAIQEREIEYKVDDMETVDLPPNSQDLIWAYEVFLHNPASKVSETIRHLIPLLQTGGRFYFNLTPELREDPELSSVINQAKENGMHAFEYELEDWGVKNVFIMMQK